MLARVFQDRVTGFYVDVGAADPINLSVTKWFYDLGWSGINIEPNRKLFERLAADRPRDINLECGAGSAVTEASFEPEVGELSTFDPRTQAAARKAGTAGKSRTVPVFPLTDILERHCEKRAIDFLKIDVEGWEHEVLKGLDLHVYRPTVLIIEAIIPQARASSHAEWESLIVAASYTFVYFDGVNRFYLANERIALQKHFQSPPNAFDDFETFSLVRAKGDAEQRLKSIGLLEAQLLESNRDREARLSQTHELTLLLKESKRDSEARLSQIEELTQLLTRIQERQRSAFVADSGVDATSYGVKERQRGAVIADPRAHPTPRGVEERQRSPFVADSTAHATSREVHGATARRACRKFASSAAVWKNRSAIAMRDWSR